MLDRSGKWESLATSADHIKLARFGPDGRLYLLSQSGAPHGKILRLPTDKLALATAEVVVPESQAVIQDLAITESRIYVLNLVGGPSQIRVLDGKGNALPSVPVLPVSSVRQIVGIDKDDLLFRNQSYTEPRAWYRYHARSGETSRTALFAPPSVSFDDTEGGAGVLHVEGRNSRSHRRSSPERKRNSTGSNPTLIFGYGGYGENKFPVYNLVARPWLDHGGIFTVAILRGGGEYGEAWHTAGKLTRKQNVFDDFIACGEHLVKTGYTRPDKLGIHGASNGGLLMGAALTQQPDLFKAVASWAGIYDVLRNELTPNGAFDIAGKWAQCKIQINSRRCSIIRPTTT